MLTQKIVDSLASRPGKIATNLRDETSIGKCSDTTEKEFSDGFDIVGGETIDLRHKPNDSSILHQKSKATTSDGGCSENPQDSHRRIQNTRLKDLLSLKSASDTDSCDL